MTMALIRLAAATAAVAISLLTLGAAAAGPDAAVAAGIAVRAVALLAAVGYWIAFLPPRPLRRFWQGTAAFGHSERLLAASPATPTYDLWAELAKTASQLTGADTVILLGEDASLRVVAVSTLKRHCPALSPSARKIPNSRATVKLRPFARG